MLETRSRRSVEQDKVPRFKFCSNDEWVVTPQESRIIEKKVHALLAVVDSGEKITLDADPFFNQGSHILDKDSDILDFIRNSADYNQRCADANVAYEVW